MPGKRGAPLGNKNGSKNRPLTELIRRALLQNDAVKARKFADALVARAIAESDRAASEILDRIEGKVPQPQTHSGDPEGSPIIHRIEQVIVDPKDDGKPSR